MFSYLILTNTYIDTQKLQEIIAFEFFKSKTNLLKINYKTIPQNTKELYLEKQNNGQIIEVLLVDKDDFKNQQSNWYQKYNQPTLLFLGDLNNYSKELQEGMLRLLEEPPHNLFPILFCQDQSQILSTIVSRCKLIQLNPKHILEILDPKLLEIIKKKLPDIKESLTAILKNNFILPDLSKVERAELDFWLWQIQTYLEALYKQNPTKAIAKKLLSIVESRNLNRQNLQKKLALARVNL